MPIILSPFSEWRESIIEIIGVEGEGMVVE
jgi:hypothetical protein